MATARLVWRGRAPQERARGGGERRGETCHAHCAVRPRWPDGRKLETRPPHDQYHERLRAMDAQGSTLERSHNPTVRGGPTSRRSSSGSRRSCRICAPSRPVRRVRERRLQHPDSPRAARAGRQRYGCGGGSAERRGPRLTIRRSTLLAKPSARHPRFIHRRRAELERRPARSNGSHQHIGNPPRRSRCHIHLEGTLDRFPAQIARPTGRLLPSYRRSNACRRPPSSGPDPRAPTEYLRSSLRLDRLTPRPPPLAAETGRPVVRAPTIRPWTSTSVDHHSWHAGAERRDRSGCWRHRDGAAGNQG